MATKVIIKQFKNKAKKPVAGLTPEYAVYDSNGVRLDAKLGSWNLSNIRDAQTESVRAVREAAKQYDHQTVINNGTITNAADEEDITVRDNVLSLKDRTYIKGVDEMGYVILRKNKSFAEQVTKENTIYEIRYEFDLGGAEVIIPEGCALKFEGGKVKNGMLSVQLLYGDVKLDKCICVTQKIYTSWFVNTEYSDILSAQNKGTEIVIDNEIILHNPATLKDNIRVYSVNGGRINISFGGRNAINIGNSNTFDGVIFNGNNISSCALHCTGKENLKVLNCEFYNFNSENVRIIKYNTIEEGEDKDRDYEGLFVKGCRFHDFGSDGVSRAIQTYGNFSNIEIINNEFYNQYGNSNPDLSEADAIHLVGKVLTDENINYPNEENPINHNHWGALKAVIKGNTFINIDKSAAKIFGGEVIFSKNVIRSDSNIGSFASVRCYGGENIVITDNTSLFENNMKNAVSIEYCKNVDIINNTIIHNGKTPVDSVIYLHDCKDINVEHLYFKSQYSTSGWLYSSILSVTGSSNILFKNIYCDINNISTFIMVEAKEGYFGSVKIEDSVFKTQKFRIPFNITGEDLNLSIKNTTILSVESSDTAYDIINVNSILFDNLIYSVPRSLDITAKSVNIKGSALSSLIIRNANTIEIIDSIFGSTYNPIIIHDIDNSRLYFDGITLENPIENGSAAAIIRIYESGFAELSVKNIDYKGDLITKGRCVRLESGGNKTLDDVAWGAQKRFITNVNYGNEYSMPIKKMDGFEYFSIDRGLHYVFNKNQRLILNPHPASATNPNGVDIGYCTFNTTLNKPVWWSGTKWVDATGADV